MHEYLNTYLSAHVSPTVGVHTLVFHTGFFLVMGPLYDYIPYSGYYAWG